MNKKLIFFCLSMYFCFIYMIVMVMCQTGTCADPYILICDTGPTHYDYDTNPRYFEFTFSTETRASIEMIPDSGMDYDLILSWIEGECPPDPWAPDSCYPMAGCDGTLQAEGCSSPGPTYTTPPGTYYAAVEYYGYCNGLGGFTIELQCTTSSTTTTSTSTSTSTTSTSTSTSTTTTIAHDCESDDDCQPYEKCDCPAADPQCTGSKHVNEDWTCYDFRPDMLGCRYYDYCDGGVDPVDGVTLCSSNWNIYCYTAEANPNYVTLIHIICGDTSWAKHIWMTCPSEQAVCGNAICETGESLSSCPPDCSS